jgi:16S rRNA (guanine(1405)-N(7))-methyltransferase
VTDQGPLLERLAAEFADEVTLRYRIDRATAIEVILSSWSGRASLVAAIARAGSADEVRRLRVYRDAATAAKREVYYRLRRYLADGSGDALAALLAAPPQERAGHLRAVAAGHVSTAERLAHLDTFRAELTARLAGAATVVDVGCGLLPLLFPLDGPGLRELWALDRDRQAIDTLTAYAHLRGDDRLRPVHWDLAEGWAAVSGLPARCDVALLLKVVPVVARRSPALLGVLADVPADRLLISGSRIAMARRADIERRETAVLLRFCASYGFTVVDRFRTADEVCMVIER